MQVLLYIFCLLLTLILQEEKIDENPKQIRTEKANKKICGS